MLLVDDHVDVRKAARSILDSYPDIDVVGEAVDGFGAILYAERLHPDVIVMNISMPRLGGIKATQMIKADRPHIIVIGLSVETRHQSIDDMPLAGASTVLKKESAS